MQTRSIRLPPYSLTLIIDEEEEDDSPVMIQQNQPRDPFLDV